MTAPSLRLPGAAILAWLVAVTPAHAQEPASRDINVYRYVFGVDVPRSPAVVGLGVLPAAVLLGSNHKPLAASLSTTLDGRSRWAAGLAVDVAPYFLFGGGRRSLQGYRAMSVLGRIQRVLTKTVLSIGVGDTGPPGGSRLALGLRSTLHDPHDPIGATQMPEEIAAAFRQAGVPMPSPADRELHGRGVDLARIYTANRQTARARAGDAQVSAGWATSLPFDDSQESTDPAEQPAPGTTHTTWIAAQYTTGPRFDLIANIQGRDVWGDESRVWLAAAVLAKGAVDVQGGAVYDASNGRIYPSVAGWLRLTRRTGLSATVGTQPPPYDLDGKRHFVAGLQGRWFYASDPQP